MWMILESLIFRCLKENVSFLWRVFFGLEGCGGDWTRNLHIISYQTTEDTEICELEARALRAEAEVLRWWFVARETPCGAEEDNHGVQFLPETNMAMEKATMLISLNLTFTLCLPGKHILFHGHVRLPTSSWRI